MDREFRVIYADHRGQGGSDKLYDAGSYLLPTRVGDAVAVLDALGIERAHVLGSSWGARLGFALGEHAPERVLSLVLCGNQPYAWNLESPIAKVVARAIAASRLGGMKGFVESFEADLDYRFPEPQRSLVLEKNDPAALEAAWQSVPAEGAIGKDLSRWRVPCLVCTGDGDEMHEDERRAAAEIPGATFVSLAGHSHISAFYEAGDLLLPHMLALMRSTMQPEQSRRSVRFAQPPHAPREDCRVGQCSGMPPEAREPDARRRLDSVDAP